MIPPIAAVLGSWAGGLVGDYLLKRGWSLNKVRKTCLVGGMLVCSVIALAAVAPQAWQALVLMSISYAAAAFTIVTIWCLPADVVDASTVATLGGDSELLRQHRQCAEPDHHRSSLRCDRLVRGTAATHRGRRRRRRAVLRLLSRRSSPSVDPTWNPWRPNPIPRNKRRPPPAAGVVVFRVGQAGGSGIGGATPVRS